MNSNGYDQGPWNSNGYMNQQNGYGAPVQGAPYPYDQYGQPQPYYQQPQMQQPQQPYIDTQGCMQPQMQQPQQYMEAQAPVKPKPNKAAMIISYIISGAGSIVLFASIFLFCAFMVPQLFGIKPYAVMTGSMEPNFPVGCLVYVQDVDPGELKVDDVITFDRTVPGQGSSIITHRIAQINPTDREFITKGDANESNDPQHVSYDSVIGKVVFGVPLVGYLALSADSWDGKVAMIAIIFGAMILCLVGVQIRRQVRKAARKKAAVGWAQ